MPELLPVPPLSARANSIHHVPEAKVSVTVTETLLLFESLAKAVATHVVPLRSLCEIEVEPELESSSSVSSTTHPARRQKARAARSRISSLEGLKV